MPARKKVNYEDFLRKSNQVGEKLALLILENSLPKRNFFGNFNLKTLLMFYSMELEKTTYDSIIESITQKAIEELAVLFTEDFDPTIVQTILHKLNTENLCLICDYLYDGKNNHLVDELLNELNINELCSVYDYFFACKNNQLVNHSMRLLFKKQEPYFKSFTIIFEDEKKKLKKVA